MNIYNQDWYESVILSAAKNPTCQAEILRCAQNDSAGFDLTRLDYPVILFTKIMLVKKAKQKEVFWRVWLSSMIHRTLREDIQCG